MSDHEPKSGKHNIARTYRMRARSVADLQRIVESGSLSAAAAMYELERRAR